MASERKSFALRLDPDLYNAVARLASADLRSVNAEIEYLLREALRARGVRVEAGAEGSSIEAVAQPTGATTAVASVTLAGPAIVRAASSADIEAAGYVRLRNEGASPDRLVALRSECAEAVQIHAASAGATRVLSSLDIPAGGVLELAPGGPHFLILVGVRRAFAPGETVKIRLSFAVAAPLELDFLAVGDSREGWEVLGG